MRLTPDQLKSKQTAIAYFGGDPQGKNFAAGPAQAIGLAQVAGPVSEGRILGVGIGARVSRLGLTGDSVVRVYVTTKNGLQIPDKFSNLPSQIIEVGDVSANATPTGNRFAKNRPTSCGVSVGHPLVTAGTLGCLVKDDSGTLCILSNNHVLANCNAASINDPIIQPATLDGGVAGTDSIGFLKKFQPINFSAGAANDIDAALAEIFIPIPITPDIIDIGNPGKTLKNATIYQSVRKHGRTTGHTVGVIVDISVSLWVSYGTQKAWFQDQIAIQGIGSSPFSSGGDSGSLIVDAVGLEPVGLLFSGSTSGLTFANPIDKVLTGLNAVFY
ncbi:chymotrypsin family serine protease [Variovorax sp. PvP013]|uniref:hypothetical protein n=1 Tax=Variovorax sp. PvP013 TaxID=3156435 RepID=UPI003D1F93D2